MNKVFLLSFLLVGCVNSSNVPVENPDSTAVQIPEQSSNQLQKAKKLFSGGVRLAYNKSKNIYEWVTSEETQEQASEFADEVKTKANDLLDQANSKLQELQK